MTGGRCHGPDCTQPALLEGGFCSERCQARWHGQYEEPRDSAAMLDLRSMPACDCLPPGCLVGWHTCEGVIARGEAPTQVSAGCTHKPIGQYRRGGVIVCAFCSGPAPQLPDSSRVAFPQVTTKDPQVGFLGRAFHWLFGRTT